MPFVTNSSWYHHNYPSQQRKGLLAINLPNGAHHSELSHASMEDTPDIKEAHERILRIVSHWLEEIKRPESWQTIVS